MGHCGGTIMPGRAWRGGVVAPLHIFPTPRTALPRHATLARARLNISTLLFVPQPCQQHRCFLKGRARSFSERRGTLNRGLQEVACGGGSGGDADWGGALHMMLHVS